MPRLNQPSFTGGEISPSLYARTDLARYATSLAKCENFIVLPTGGISNRAGLEYVATLATSSLAAMIPFVFSTEQSYMLVLQEGIIQVYSNGSFVAGLATINVSDVIISVGVGTFRTRTISTAPDPHPFTAGQQIEIAGVVGTGDYAVNGAWTVLSTPSSTTFTIKSATAPITGVYTSGGVITYSEAIETDYLSEDLYKLRYTQSADVVTIVHQRYYPAEFVRNAASSFSYDYIDDFKDGPFLDSNTSTVTMTASASTGTVTLTASAATFVAQHIGSQVRLDLEDISAIPPWEASKELAAVGVNPQNELRRSLGKVYRCATNETAASFPIYTGTVRPSHDEGTESDGDGNPIASLASRAGVDWEYLHSLYGIATITAVALDGLTATATVDSYIPIVSPATTETWALGAWSHQQGYPGVVTYYGDRMVLANTPLQPQTEWASKVGEYHDFGESAPLVDDDAITQTLNARQVNAIVELIPMDQLVALTASSSWASPKRGEPWTPTTIGFDPQGYVGAADLPAVVVGDLAIYVQRGMTKVRSLEYAFDRDKYGGEELSVLARHLFGRNRTITDMAYAEEPHGILWIIRSDGALIGLTYLREQQVIGWHRHSTDGFFERVKVIPEEGRDVPYFVVRRTINGQSVRFLERMADRELDDILDGFFVDCGLSYDGRNTTSKTMTIGGVSYNGGDTVTLTASDLLDITFSFDDVGDVIEFNGVRVLITATPLTYQATGELQTPVPEELQNVPTTEWTFARDTFSGLDHLNGAEVAICADGCVLAPQVVSGGAVTIPNPAGVVHIGLAYVAEAETLEVTVFGSPESVRDRAKIIPSVSVVLQDTVGLQVGASRDFMEPLTNRENEFYTDPSSPNSGVGVGYTMSTWQDSGRVILRQADPLPATILAVVANVKYGESG